MKIRMVGDLLQYHKDTDEPYCPECEEDLSPEEVFTGRCKNCAENVNKAKEVGNDE